ncbi:NAD(P)H-dependent flavin oxidoreductase [Gordonia aichiensis]|uniref:Probable nitronate monooxygenase n=1 Tax=Gordonia aichiensis NBRC 108223 TaxID=1220583 RepID=L7KQT8_9ACTN|nr:nitronate monooxygenase [Gordonia aichiensis]GAC50068.1 putative 2-nitropropane dioxygenase [Gordonia aichiensis NBRC 108223]
MPDSPEMFDLMSLRVPIVVAPMAGGPTTPALVIAAAHAQAMGFLAAGYKTPQALAAEIDEVVASEAGTYGVNLFVPGGPFRDLEAVRHYRDELAPVARRYNVEVGAVVESDDDAYAAKLDVVIQRRVPVVSFTFGLPDDAVLARLHEAGIAAVATVADPDAATRAAALGVDALCVQGMQAGGHRGTLSVDAEPLEIGTVELVRQVAEVVDLPIIAAGGIATGAHVDDALAAGAVAVQLGTAFLDSAEAGTKPTHRAALRNPRFTDTVVTRAFSGRPARALRNEFTDRYTPLAPAEYPQLHHLTSPLRSAAALAGDPEFLNLWAGTSFRDTGFGPAEEIIARIWSQTTAAAAARASESQD